MYFFNFILFQLPERFHTAVLGTFGVRLVEIRSDDVPVSYFWSSDWEDAYGIRAVDFGGDLVVEKRPRVIGPTELTLQKLQRNINIFKFIGFWICYFLSVEAITAVWYYPYSEEMSRLDWASVGWDVAFGIFYLYMLWRLYKI